MYCVLSGMFGAGGRKYSHNLHDRKICMYPCMRLGPLPPSASAWFLSLKSDALNNHDRTVIFSKVIAKCYWVIDHALMKHDVICPSNCHSTFQGSIRTDIST